MVSQTPGLKRRPRADGSVAYYWVATAVTKDAGDYPLKTIRLHGDKETIAQRCRVMTAELRLWLSEKGLGEAPAYDGSVKSLIAVYRRTAESPYHGLKHNTRVMYDESLDLLERTVGDRQLAKLTGLDFMRWYNNLKVPAKHTDAEKRRAAELGVALQEKPERMRRAYKVMQLWRIIAKFGVVANIRDCVRVSGILSEMEFSQPTARREFIDFDQAGAICEQAIADGARSIAIAQALQFELTLRQIDVIGEWVPTTADQHGIVDRGDRWQGGLLWSHLDAHGVIMKDTTKTGFRAQHDTMAYPYLRQMLDTVPAEKRVGPVVVNEATGLPWRRREFAKRWRKIASKVGIPSTVLNRDSRAGGITEGSDAGADREHLRHHANHSNGATTELYNRSTLTKTRKVAELRVARRAAENDLGPDAEQTLHLIGTREEFGSMRRNVSRQKPRPRCCLSFFIRRRWYVSMSRNSGERRSNRR